MSSTKNDESKSKPAETGIPADAWMIRGCLEYKEELLDCKNMRGRRYQKYVYGEKLDCSHWKHAYDLCNKYVNRKDIEALKELIAIEEGKRQIRLKRARNNDVWEYRATPPEDWNAPTVHKSFSGKEFSAGSNEIVESKSRCSIS